MTARELLIHAWRSEYVAFVDVLESLPAGRLDFRPDPEAPSASELAWRLLQDQALGATLLERGESRRRQAAPLRTVQALVVEFRRDHAALAHRLATAADDAMHQTGRIEERDAVTEAPVMNLLTRLLIDAVDCRGRLSVYVFLMGGRLRGAPRRAAAASGTHAADI